MSRYTAAALFGAALSLGIAFIGLILILSPQASAEEGGTLPVAERDGADRDRSLSPSDAPSAVPALASGALTDHGFEPAGAIEASVAGPRSEFTPFLTALTVSAVLGLLGWRVVRRWFRVPDAERALATPPAARYPAARRPATGSPAAPGARDRSV